MELIDGNIYNVKSVTGAEYLLKISHQDEESVTGVILKIIKHSRNKNTKKSEGTLISMFKNSNKFSNITDRMRETMNVIILDG